MDEHNESIMIDYQPVIDRIAQQTETLFRRATKKELTTLRSLHFPESIIAFYAQYALDDFAEGNGHLWSVEDIRELNRNGVPGEMVSPYGYLEFASTLCGDAYCLNLNKLDPRGEPEIVLISHECAEEGITAEQAARLAKRVTASLYDFLEKFSNGTLDEECIDDDE